MRDEINALKLENKKLKDANKKLSVLLSFEKNKVKALEQKYDKYVLEESLRFEKAINKAIKEVRKEYESIIVDLKNEIAKLQAQLNLNSSNSSLPSSKNKIGTKIPNNREKSDKKIGGQVGHKAHKLNHFKPEEITFTDEHTLDKCPNCNGSLKEENVVISDIIDFEVKVTKTRNNIHNYKCCDCGKRVTANSTLPRGVSYGNNINAMALDLMNTSNVALNKITKHIRGISNNEINMSEGYLAKLQRNCASKLDSFIDDLKNHIIKLKVLHWDDTTCKVNTIETYMRYYGDDNFVLLIPHEHKNEAGIDADNILGRLTKNTVCVHDHVLLNYNNKFSFQNAECNAHIIRYLNGVKDNLPDHTWQDKLKKLLNDANDEKKELLSKSNNKKVSFDPDKLQFISNEYDTILELGFKENSKTEDYHYYKDDELKLLKRLQKFKENHLLYLYNLDVPYTNNTAELGLRKVKRKLAVSDSFKSFAYQEFYAKILSYLETCERNGIPKFNAALRLVSGNPYTIEEIIEFAEKKAK